MMTSETCLNQTLNKTETWILYKPNVKYSPECKKSMLFKNYKLQTCLFWTQKQVSMKFGLEGFTVLIHGYGCGV